MRINWLVARSNPLWTSKSRGGQTQWRQMRIITGLDARSCSAENSRRHRNQLWWNRLVIYQFNSRMWLRLRRWRLRERQLQGSTTKVSNSNQSWSEKLQNQFRKNRTEMVANTNKKLRKQAKDSSSSHSFSPLWNCYRRQIARRPLSLTMRTVNTTLLRNSWESRRIPPSSKKTKVIHQA